jgi:hypothetical protein
MIANSECRAVFKSECEVPLVPFDDSETFESFSRNAAIVFNRPPNDEYGIEDVKQVNGQGQVAGASGGVIRTVIGLGRTMKQAPSQVPPTSGYSRIKNVLIPNSSAEQISAIAGMKTATACASGTIEIGQAELHGASDLSSAAIRWWAILIVPAECDGQSNSSQSGVVLSPAVRGSLDLWLSEARLAEEPSCESLKYPNRNAVSC